MESFGTLKRRTTDLMSSMPSELPQFPNLSGLSSKLPKMPNFGRHAHPSNPTVKATWERIDVPPVSRSSHTINIVSGNAYIFGGEVNPREPVDNEMHVIVLPFSSAGADYYNVKAKAAPRVEPPIIPTVIEPTEDDDDDNDEEEEGKEKELSDIPLASPLGEGEDIATASGHVSDGPDRSVSKGKQPARANVDTASLGNVPAPRVGHATAVIGNRIFLFGGRGGPDMKPLEEYGRVWVFDTKTHLWSYLDSYLPAAEPLSPAFADKRTHYPAARSYHSAAAVAQPREFNTRGPRRSGGGPGRFGGAVGGGLKRTETWTEWAQGDSEIVGTPQRPIVGNVANNSRDEDDEGYGTFIVHGGCLENGGRANDTWAFDVHSRVWQELPSAPGKPRGGTSLAVAGGKLWRYGGFNGESEEGGQLDYLALGVDDINDQSVEGDVVLSAKGEWKSIQAEDLPGHPAPTKVEGGDEESAQPLAKTDKPYWPGNRSVAGMQTVTIGGVAGREYLILLFGERDPSNAGHEAAGKFWDDIWAYELTRPTTAASVMGAVFGNKSGAGAAATEPGKWFKVETEAYDDEDDTSAAGPGPRGWFATAHMGELEERGVVVWGGLNDANQRLGDGWILRMGSEKREP